MKKTRLFKHFITLIHCCALAIPLFTLIGTFIFNYLAPAAYFASHKNGNNSSYEINYKYQSNEVNSVDDFIEGNIYQFNNLEPSYFSSFNNFSFNLISGNLHFDNLEYDDLYVDTNTFQNYITITFNSINTTNILVDIYIGDILFYDFYCSKITSLNDYAIIELLNIHATLTNIFLTYTDYNEIESVEIENHNDFEDMKNYQPKTFDDACFYTLKSLGAFKYEGDSLDEMLDSHYNYDLDDVLDLYLGFDDLTTLTYRTGVVNYDWFELFNVNAAIKNNQSTWLFFVNYYINYFINISLITFMPIVIMGFLKFCTNLILKFIEKGEDY